MTKYFTGNQIDKAATLLEHGGVMAYPTEAVYGMGCDPHNQTAFVNLLALKQRPLDHGVLLIAAEIEEIEYYIDLEALPTRVWVQVRQTWPGFVTWIFPCTPHVPDWVQGKHGTVALRVTAHGPSVALCRAFGGALVSTSANPHGAPPARSAQEVLAYFADAVDGKLDGVLDAPLGQWSRPSTIRDARTGMIVRA